MRKQFVPLFAAMLLFVPLVSFAQSPVEYFSAQDSLTTGTLVLESSEAGESFDLAERLNVVEAAFPTSTIDRYLIRVAVLDDSDDNTTGTILLSTSMTATELDASNREKTGLVVPEGVAVIIAGRYRYLNVYCLYGPAEVTITRVK